MKQVSGYLADNGRFCETAEQAWLQNIQDKLESSMDDFRKFNVRTPIGNNYTVRDPRKLLLAIAHLERELHNIVATAPKGKE